MDNFNKAIECLKKVSRTVEKPGVERVNIGDTIYFQSSIGGYVYGVVKGIYPSGNLKVESKESGEISQSIVYRDTRYNIYLEY